MLSPIKEEEAEELDFIDVTTPPRFQIRMLKSAAVTKACDTDPPSDNLENTRTLKQLTEASMPDVAALQHRSSGTKARHHEYGIIGDGRLDKPTTLKGTTMENSENGVYNDHEVPVIHSAVTAYSTTRAPLQEIDTTPASSQS